VLPQTLEYLDFRFENSRAKIVANCNYPETKLAGITIGPLQEGNEYEAYYWIASELAREGIAHFREEETLDTTKLFKVQWGERGHIAGQISELPQQFYPKLRRYLESLKQQAAIHPEKIQEYLKSKNLADDITSSRLKKIVNLAAGPIQNEHILNKLTDEERNIYMELGKAVNHWRTKILLQGTEG
jgi:hypothetical protein